ncbi:MAG: SDR family NAD(P)-dependent oxidoreductase [Dehalococcoidia bacterium]|nr:SDR family NAD(P)-dependent oxidoreductase [Dehalococcoidia bacterium]MYD28746.1 SDR family NAD(P)-dependent oxidoreductase [Dehalococcoidia bacterium]
MQELNGKVAVITGGGSGIGRCMALAFADEGMDIAIGDIEAGPGEAVAQEVRAKGRQAISVTCDVTDLDSVRALAETTKAELGAYHVVCNNAGVISGGPTTEMSAAEWDWVLDVDLQGVVNGVIAFLPGLVEQGEGHIVNTASIAGLVPMAAPGVINYTTAKYGVVGITETLHDELAPTGVGASALCPGVVNTRISQSARNRPDAAGGPVSEEDMGPPLELPPGMEMPRIIGANIREPEEMAARVVEGVKANDLYIVTHPETREAVEERFAAIMAAFDKLEASLG